MSGLPPDRPALPGNRWEVQFLGGLHLRNGDIEIRHFPRQAATVLFARLALRPRTVQSREDLALALWPEGLDPARREAGVAAEPRRSRLRRVLSELRGLLERRGTPPGWALVADRDLVRLNPEAFEVDTFRFERLVARGESRAALDLYRGEFLPGVKDPWVDGERSRLAALAQRAMAELDAAGPDGGFDDELEEHAAPAENGGGKDDDVAGPVVPYVTRFFGREAEIEALRQAVAGNRLVTVTGPVGTGKTRLVTEAARQMDGFDPVVPVGLAPCTDPAQVGEYLRAALGLQPAARPALDQVGARLARQRALLILDNFEQLVGDAGNALLTNLLERLPEAHLLLTSCVALDGIAHRNLRLDPLPPPEPQSPLETAARNPAVALFLDRARAARADFSLNSRNVEAIVEVCRLLDGLPLSIEIVAAKVRRHRPHEMVQALQRSRKLLTRPQMQAARHGRHGSLDAALEWSWSLLGDDERDLLRGLSVFRGGFTLADVEALAPEAPVERALAALARHSLVHVQAGTGHLRRLAMIEVVREFVGEKLHAAQALALRRRHRGHFLARAREIDSLQTWAAEADLPNFIQALTSACDDDDPATAAGLALALDSQWRARGAPASVIGLLGRLVQAAGLQSAQRVALHSLLAALLLNVLRAGEAHDQVERAIAVAGDDDALRAPAVLMQATVFWRGAEDGDRAIELARQMQSLVAGLPEDAEQQRLRARALLIEGAVTLDKGNDPVEAGRMFEQAERLFGLAGDQRTSLLALPGRTACLVAQERHAEVIRVASAGAQRAAELGDIVTRLQLLNRVDVACAASGQFERALDACQRQTRLAWSQGLSFFVAFGLWNQCLPLVELGRPQAAARMMAFARRYWIDQGGRIEPDDEAYLQKVQARARTRISEAEWRAEWARGEAMGLRGGIAQGSGLGGGTPTRSRV